MKEQPLPVWFVKLAMGALVTICLSLQSWSLMEIVGLKQAVAGLSARIESIVPKVEKTQIAKQ